ncbi:serine protease [Deinococcus sp. 6YEL10]|jgi:serine protease Do|nr:MULTISPECIES: S1C family serine protease [unclassified Deinococcus]MCD0158519.1 serine protease [Deinococcus sp. 6GRE01]MCD0161780.1 serine protease [Deinococcus sp. 6YEL10]MCD0171624.1 serine protease [Deinococcus sp. 23YEL01]
MSGDPASLSVPSATVPAARPLYTGGVRASPWLPVLLILALAAYLLPDARLPFDPPAVTRTAPQAPAPALPNQLPEAARELFDAARPATVRVESLNPATQNAGIGTGFFISEDGLILTAYHVVSSGRLFQVSTLSGRSYPAQVTAFDAQADVALLQVRAPAQGFPFLPLAPRAPRVGEAVLAIGNSGGDYLQPRRGTLLGLNAQAGRADFPQGTLEMNAPLAPGDSGGPILDRSGQAIGVVSYISLDGSGQTRRSYAVPVEEGSDLITALRAGEKRDVPVVGLLFDLVHSGQGGLDGAVISGVARRSPAERAGLRGSTFDEQDNLTALGDIVTSVNGQRTRDADQVIAAIRRARVGDTVTLGYTRDGEARTAQITLVPKASVPDLQE